MTSNKKQSESKSVFVDRAADKEWVRSNDGQRALNQAREEVEKAVRQLQTSQPVLTELVKRKFVY
ncbi:MAG: hypothetical protein P4L53_11995 [Candidatus Obscuribacterales bacterium]|nr:hypothetical protein [Candidatus Obscuribacterales bacterium]